METVVVQRTRTTVDLLLWRRYGIAGLGLVEQVWALNPGLADLGPVLPVGTEVLLPEAPTASELAATERKIVNLFGDA